MSAEDLVKQLLPGFGAVLAAAFVLAPGGILTHYLTLSRVIRVKHTADWTAWAAASGLLFNLFTMAILSGIFRVDLTDTKAMLSTWFLLRYALILALCAALLSWAAAVVLSKLQNHLLRTRELAAQSLLESGTRTSVTKMQSVLSSFVDALNSAAATRRPWRVHLTTSHGVLAGYLRAVPVPDIHDTDVSDGLLFLPEPGQADGATPALSFVPWSCIETISLLPPPKNELAGMTEFTFITNDPQASVRLAHAGSAAYVEGAVIIKEPRASIRCAVLRTTGPHPPVEIVATTVVPDKWGALPAVQPVVLMGATQVQHPAPIPLDRVTHLSGQGQHGTVVDAGNGTWVIIRRVRTEPVHLQLWCVHIV